MSTEVDSPRTVKKTRTVWMPDPLYGRIGRYAERKGIFKHAEALRRLVVEGLQDAPSRRAA